MKLKNLTLNQPNQQDTDLDPEGQSDNIKFIPKKSSGIFKKVALAVIILVACMICGGLAYEMTRGAPELTQSNAQTQVQDQPIQSTKPTTENSNHHQNGKGSEPNTNKNSHGQTDKGSQGQDDDISQPQTGKGTQDQTDKVSQGQVDKGTQAEPVNEPQPQANPEPVKEPQSQPEKAPQDQPDNGAQPVQDSQPQTDKGPQADPANQPQSQPEKGPQDQPDNGAQPVQDPLPQPAKDPELPGDKPAQDIPGIPKPVIQDKGMKRFPGADLGIGPGQESPYEKEARAVKDAYLADINALEINLGDRTDKMLVGISIGPAEFERRSLIRKHQIDPYPNYNVTWRFVMARPDPSLNDALKLENDTYGDLIILTTMEDSRENARIRKPFAFFKYVEENMPVYKYVAKMDSDTYINMADFSKDFFNHEIQDSNDLSIISLFIHHLGKFDWPQGGFEAVSYKTMLLLNRFYALVPLSSVCEDMQIEFYMFDAQIPYKKIDMTDNRAYDFRRGDHPHVDTDIHPDTVRVHQLKSNSDYVNIASCFNENGVDMTRVEELRKSNWT